MSLAPITERKSWFDARTVLIAVLMVAGVIATYLPWSVLSGRDLVIGADHVQLHARRMKFARDHLFGPSRALPAWYPRELMGTPFRANLQNFPWIPTRLLVLAIVNPDHALGIGAALSASLAAIFTLLFCRRLGMNRIGSAAAGWTFACCGFYASRILAGHLPLLEAFPALPALLWLTDRAMDPDRRQTRIDWSLIALGLTATCFALAGHPQLTVYGLAFASLYALVARERSVRRGLCAIGAMALGVGIAGFALYPMALLTRRTTRVLPLEQAWNDLAMPVARLGALLFPWKDGWPPAVRRAPAVPFTGYSNDAFFWDTVCYVGWAPLLAVIALAAFYLYRRTWPTRRAIVVAIIGVLALALAMPLWQRLMSAVPGTFLRSPARLMYVVGFALALAFGAGVHWLSRMPGPRAVALAVAAIVIAIHAADLVNHDRAFIVRAPVDRTPFPFKDRDQILQTLREGRVGFDYELNHPLNRVIDDVGFFDSIILAKPYRFVCDTSGVPPETNVQNVSGGEMQARTLRAAGVRILWTSIERPDLTELGKPISMGSDKLVHTYVVRDAAQRCEFFGFDRVLFDSEVVIHARLRNPTYPIDQNLMLATEHRPATIPEVGFTQLAAELRYKRPSSDQIVVNITTNQPGYARILESWDTGWHATVDGSPAQVLAGNDVFLTVPIAEGKHELRLIYRTPGARVGIIISIACAILLAGLSLAAPRFAAPTARPRVDRS